MFSKAANKVHGCDELTGPCRRRLPANWSDCSRNRSLVAPIMGPKSGFIIDSDFLVDGVAN